MTILPTPQVYTIYSVLFIVFIILILVTAFVTVALTYFQLAAEDHRWGSLANCFLPHIAMCWPPVVTVHWLIFISARRGGPQAPGLAG